MDFFSFVFNTAGRLFTYSDFQWPDASVAMNVVFFFFFFNLEYVEVKKGKGSKIRQHQPPCTVENGQLMNSGSPTLRSHCSSMGRIKKTFFFSVVVFFVV